jgi:hypothetical protein
MENNVRIETMYETPEQVSDVSTDETSSDVVVNETKEEKVGDVEVKKEEPKIDLSNRFAKLSKKEKELRELETSVKAKQLEIEKWNEVKTKAKTNPADILSELGISLEDFLMTMAGEEPPVKELTEMEVLKNEIESLKKARELEKEATEVEAKAKQEKAAKEKEEHDAKVILDFRNDIKLFVEKNAEQYEIVKAQEAYEYVFDVIEAHFNDSGEVMPTDKAAGMVEEYLENQYRALLSLNKFKKNTEVVKEDVREVKEIKESVKTPKTLNNGMTNSSSSKSGNSKLTYEQRLAEAAKLLADG